MLFVKQSTVVTVQFGPFLDAGDGVTPETGLASALDNATTGIRVSKNGLAMVDRSSTTAPAHDVAGFYRVELNATDTDTLGTLLIQFEELATTLPVWATFMVMPANVWDAMFGADKLQVDQREIVGTTVPTPTTAGVPDVNVERWLDTLVTLSGSLPDVNVEAMDAGSIAVGVLATNAIAAASIAAAALDGKGDWNVGKTGYSISGTITTLDGLNDLSAANVNAEVLDVMNVDTFGEPAQGAFGETVSIFSKINALYKCLINEKDGTSTLIQIYNFAGSVVDHKRTVSKVGGLYNEKVIVSGP